MALMSIMIGLLFHIVPFIEWQLTVSTVIILTCSALFCLVHILCSVTIKAPHISHETVLHTATLSFYSVCERRTRNRQRGYYTKLLSFLSSLYNGSLFCHTDTEDNGNNQEKVGRFTADLLS